MQKVLMYNIKNPKSTNIKVICHKLGIGFEEIEKDSYGFKLGYLAGITDDNTISDFSDFNGEMLLLVGFSNSTLNVFLAESRRKKASVALKAVLTETNSEFNSSELFKEISAEHQAMQSGENAH